MSISAITFKISLAYIEPEIYRRVLVPPDYSLLDLHQIIQMSFGWEDRHLFIFEVGDMRFINSHDWEEDAYRYQDASKALLSELVPNIVPIKSKFIYTYDLGDGWRHEVMVEDVEMDDEILLIPICIGGERSGPPEDIGGPFFYQEFLESLKTPGRSKFDEIIEWLPEGFDPEHFQLSMINQKFGKHYWKEEAQEESSWLIEIDEFNSVSNFESEWTKNLSEEDKDIAESLPFRQDLVTMLNYIKQHRVKGTQATGNFPLKHIRAMTSKFVNPPELDHKIGDRVYKLRTEDEVPYLVFLHNFANIAQLILGGEGLEWEVSYPGERFLERRPEEQVWYMISNWFGRINWYYWYPWMDYYALIPHNEFQNLIIELLLSYSADSEMKIKRLIEDLDKRSPNWIKFSGNIDQSRYKKYFLIYVVLEPMNNLGIVNMEGEDFPVSPNSFAFNFKVTNFGKRILEYYQK